MNYTECTEVDEANVKLMDTIGYWVEGVALLVVAFIGIIFNTTSSIILTTKEMRNSFNLLLVGLATFDSLYLAGSVLESLRKSFDVTSNIQVLLFPYVLYPGQMIMMSASIFMTVAIAMERYVAVHYPLDYNQAMNDERASLKRVLKYVVPVLAVAIIFNIPKFFEAEVSYFKNATSTYLDIEVTPLRLEVNYAIYYNNWTRLVVLGIIPFAALVFFNSKIYNDVQVRKRNYCPKILRKPKKGQKSSPAFSSNVSRRKYEDNLATVFLGIVFVFLICHFPRIVLSLHETMVIETLLECAKNGRYSFQVWAHILNYFSHLLLAVNSSVNSLIYCGLSSRFRRHLLRIIAKIGHKIGLVRDPPPPKGVHIIASSITRNGVRASKGMTTLGKPESIQSDPEINNITQTTQV